MDQKNTVIVPELIGILRRELVRQLVATFCWHPTGAPWLRQRQVIRQGGVRIPISDNGNALEKRDDGECVPHAEFFSIPYDRRFSFENILRESRLKKPE